MFVPEVCNPDEQPVPHMSQTACFGPETLIQVAAPGNPGGLTWKKIIRVAKDDWVWVSFMENATTVIRRLTQVLCVVICEQPLIAGVPPDLALVEGAAITPTHHILSDGQWCSASSAAHGKPFLEVLEVVEDLPNIIN